MSLLKKKNRLRELRKAKEISGYDLQILSNIPAEVIYRIERGLKSPNRHEKALLSEALGLDEEEVFPSYLLRNPEIVRG